SQARAHPRRSGSAGAARPDAGRAGMSDPENFIARWSRRKRKAAADPDPTESADSHATDANTLDRHGRARPGHPRLASTAQDVDARPKSLRAGPAEGGDPGAGHDDGESGASKSKNARPAHSGEPPPSVPPFDLAS